ncbi:class II aldolase/adducin family protein [Rhizobium alvei]|uniref:Class II aldolase/adducin family protein n=1 Tax=Rhizobium alvei TaxID=1132659 RepID=A0ABT8YRQ0_9HYPH|nr:class II aldolase/adducin family protein [Rhizobium alvei]MDO6965992.1 class II aldolase/adducin family protein [Rhizobium alvei]
MVRFKEARQEIVETCRYLADNGYVAGTGGNIGLRVDDRLMAVTPSATDYYTMTAEDVPLLSLDTMEVVEGTTVPTIERSLHAAMLRKHPTRRASIHTHQPIASAVALLHEQLPWPTGSDFSALGAHVALVGYRPSGTGMLAKLFAKSLKADIYAYLLASHGVICAGENLAVAVDMIRKVEAAAAIHLKTSIEKRTNLDSELRTFLLNVLEKAETKGA